MTAVNTAAKAHTGQDRSKPEGSAHMRPVDGARRTCAWLTARGTYLSGLRRAAHMRLVDGAHSSDRWRTLT